jgi:5'-AMP-activated protein kinase regulatory beta subunit
MGNFTGKEGGGGGGGGGEKDGAQGIFTAGDSIEVPTGHNSAFNFQGPAGFDNDGMDIEKTVAALGTDELVPTVFRWEHGGRQVYITGTFNNWEHQIPMHRSGNDFAYIHNLKKGKHAFKFIVDDEWRFAPDQPTVADIEGRINNFIDVSDFEAYTGDENYLLEKQKVQEDVDETFSQIRPELDEYTKEPPPLPPHLRHIILNKVPLARDALSLSIPQHVALNHLYCTAIKDGMMVLGVTQRYSEKYVTTIYYSNI